MDLVVDANILFAALIKESISAELLFHPGFTLYAPEFLLTEFREHEKEILAKSKRTPQEFQRLLDVFTRRIAFIPQQDLKAHLKNAVAFTPDIDDTPYLALAILLDAALWSNDKKLLQQKCIKVYSTIQLIDKSRGKG